MKTFHNEKTEYLCFDITLSDLTIEKYRIVEINNDLPERGNIIFIML